MAQIKTFVEMDSHEEKVYQAVRQTQEREAKQKMREKAKELQRQRMEFGKKGGLGRSNYGGGSSSDAFGSSGGISSSTSISSSSISMADIKPSPTISKPAPTRNALKLGGKAKDVDSFVDQLKSEGEKISAVTANAPTNLSVTSRPKADVVTDS